MRIRSVVGRKEEESYTLALGPSSCTLQQTVADYEDLQAQKFIVAYAAFLKRQGKIRVPGMSQPRFSTMCSWRTLEYLVAERCMLWMGVEDKADVYRSRLG